MTLLDLKKKHVLTGARIGVLTGTSPRAVRCWLAPDGDPKHKKIPYSAWWLLRILLGEAAPEEIIREAEEKAVQDKSDDDTLEKPEGLKAYASEFSRMGGAVSSKAKAAAARENGRKGGWPKGRPRKTV
jgi:hypothetical protein